MRYAIHKKGQSEIMQVIEAPPAFIVDITPTGCEAVAVDIDVSDSTHIIANGQAVRKPQEGA